MPRFPALLLLLACTRDDPGKSVDSDGEPSISDGSPSNLTQDTDETATGPTGTTSSGGVTASCAPTANVLRYDCTATTPVEAAGTWTLSRNGAVVHTWTTPAGTTHATTLWGMAADADYAWTFTGGDGAAAGTIRTGSLPADLDDLTITQTGTAVAVSQVLAGQVCGSSSFLLMIDAAGDVIWYQDVGATGPGAGLIGYNWTSDGTILYGSGQTSIHEILPSGAEILSASGFDRPLHHDLTRGGAYVYALNAAQHDTRVVDGFYVLDAGGATVATWDLADHVTLTGSGQGNFWAQWFPGADDWSHANAIWSDGTDVIVSLRWQDTVLKIAGDPNAADFGEIRWALAGMPGNDIPDDFTWTDGGSFDGQHHATPTADGIALFDNGAMNVDSRAVTLSLDTAAGTVRETASWSVDAHCDIQGGAWPLADGGMLATCATEGRVLELVAGAADAVWTLDVSCGDAGGPGGPALARAVPVTF